MRLVRYTAGGETAVGVEAAAVDFESLQRSVGGFCVDHPMATDGGEIPDSGGKTNAQECECESPHPQ